MAKEPVHTVHIGGFDVSVYSYAGSGASIEIVPSQDTRGQLAPPADSTGMSKSEENKLCGYIQGLIDQHLRANGYDAQGTVNHADGTRPYTRSITAFPQILYKDARLLNKQAGTEQLIQACDDISRRVKGGLEGLRLAEGAHIAVEEGNNALWQEAQLRKKAAPYIVKALDVLAQHHQQYPIPEFEKLKNAVTKAMSQEARIQID